MVNKDRLDDFEDRGSIHISTIGYVILYNRGDEGDDEFWGYIFTQIISNVGEEVLSVGPDIIILERMSSMINIMKNAETELISEFVFTPKLDCGASQKVIDELVSPLIFLDFEIIDVILRKVF